MTEGRSGAGRTGLLQTTLCVPDCQARPEMTSPMAPESISALAAFTAPSARRQPDQHARPGPEHVGPNIGGAAWICKWLLL